MYGVYSTRILAQVAPDGVGEAEAGAQGDLGGEHLLIAVTPLLGNCSALCVACVSRGQTLPQSGCLCQPVSGEVTWKEVMHFAPTTTWFFNAAKRNMYKYIYIYILCRYGIESQLGWDPSVDIIWGFTRTTLNVQTQGFKHLHPLFILDVRFKMVRQLKALNPWVPFQAKSSLASGAQKIATTRNQPRQKQVDILSTFPHVFGLR